MFGDRKRIEELEREVKKYQDLYHQEVDQHNKTKGDVEVLNKEIKNLQEDKGKLEGEIDAMDVVIKKQRSDIKDHEEYADKIDADNRAKDITIRENVANAKISELELDTKLKEAESKNKVLEGEIEYKDELIGKLRELPEVKSMLSNLQKLSVPGMEELKTFAEIIKGTGSDEIVNLLKEVKEAKTKIELSHWESRELSERIGREIFEAFSRQHHGRY